MCRGLTCVSNWKWPAIEGLQRFQGKLCHSAKWDDSYDFTGKSVAVIGIGSSGIQIVPQLAKGIVAPNSHPYSTLGHADDKI